MDLFKEVLPAIQQTKVDIFSQDVADAEKSYNTFMVNRALSLHNDSLFHANEMNRNYHLDKRTQFNYFLHSIRARKRPFVPWAKKEKNDDINVIKWFFNYSEQKAIAALRVLPEAEVERIKELYKDAHK